MRKYYIPIALLLLVVVSAMAYYFLTDNTTYTENSAFQAVPMKTPLVVEVPEINRFIEQADSKSEVVSELKSIPIFQAFWKDLSDLKSLLNANAELGEVLGDKSLLIALNPEGKNRVGALFAVSLKNKGERGQIVNFLKKAQQSNELLLTERDYDGQSIYHVKSKNKNFFLAEAKGILLFSRTALFVDESIRQISSENLLSEEEFKNLYSTVSSSSSFNLFFNHKTIAQFLEKLTAPEFRRTVRQVSNLAEWCELDVNMKKSQFWFNGFSFPGKAHDNYFSVFKNQTGERFTMDRVLSVNTSLFLNFNLHNFRDFQEDYVEYLKQKGSAFYNRETTLTQLKQVGRKSLIDLFAEISDNDFAMAFGSVTQNEPTQNRFFIAKVKSQSKAKELLLPFMERFALRNDKKLADTESPYQLQEDLAYSIYEFPVPEVASLLFGHAFTAVDCKYLCFYDNYLIFADNELALKNYIHDLVLSATLSKDTYFKRFNEQMASRSNFYFYINWTKAFNLAPYYLSEEATSYLKEYEQSVRKFYALGWQIGANSGALLNNMYLHFDPTIKEAPQTEWQSKLDTTISIKPQIVTNHDDRANKEVLVQDHKNNLYLINKEGVRLWKVQLSDPIMSEVYQVDYYRNGKLQYLFNTKNKLYLIDRNGNNVTNFPVNFRSPATNGIAVFDYDNNKNYRFFIACENKQTYAYDKTGKVLSGWQAGKTDSEVKTPLQHFRIDGKDYIVCNDRYNTYILNRRGDVRVKTSANFEHSNNPLYLVKAGNFALATTDVKGKVHLQYFTGETKTLDLGTYGKDHFFTTADFNNDGQYDYVIADNDELRLFSDRGKELMSKKFSGKISNCPNIYTFQGNTKKIGVVCSAENRVYLIGVDGKLHSGFPLHGNTDFSIGYMSRGNSFFNLLVGNQDNSFYNYKVE